MHRDKDLHSSLDSGPSIHKTLSLWCCTQPHASLSGYLIKAAQPQRSTERQGLEGEAAGKEGWKTQITEIMPGCSQGSPRRSSAPMSWKPSSMKTIKLSQHYHCFWLRGWLPRGHGSHHGIQRKSQLRNLCITVLSKSNPNMTLCNLIALQSG